MARPWRETVGAHRRDVRAAIIQASWNLVHDKGALAITMADVAEEAQVSRPTLYKHFASVEDVLAAAHDERVEAHLAHLEEVVAALPDPLTALRALVTQYAEICYARARTGRPDLHALFHQGGRHQEHEEQLLKLFARAIATAKTAGCVQGNATPDELAVYSVAALAAAGRLPEASLPILVSTVLAGLVVPHESRPADVVGPRHPKPRR